MNFSKKKDRKKKDEDLEVESKIIIDRSASSSHLRFSGAFISVCCISMFAISGYAWYWIFYKGPTSVINFESENGIDNYSEEYEGSILDKSVAGRVMATSMLNPLQPKDSNDVRTQNPENNKLRFEAKKDLQERQRFFERRPDLVEELKKAVESLRMFDGIFTEQQIERALQAAKRLEKRTHLLPI